ncbi:MAG: hypothetical protein LBV68_00475 [Spirochaetaceae bacterium]|nr:hypothetical protein [Spirochaetaceae bacterium]
MKYRGIAVRQLIYLVVPLVFDIYCGMNGAAIEQAANIQRDRRLRSDWTFPEL